MPLDSRYQQQLMIKVATDMDFAKDILKVMTPDILESQILKVALVTLQEYYTKYDHIPKDLNLLLNFCDMTKKNNSYKTSVGAFVRMVQNNKAQLASKEYNFMKDYVHTYFTAMHLKNINHEIKDVCESMDVDRMPNIINKIRKALTIGTQFDLGYDAKEYVDEEYEILRDPIPTGLLFVDEKIGGLGKGMMGLVIAQSGKGKSTLLSLIANEACVYGKNVIHFIFDENDPRVVKRYHQARWVNVPVRSFKKDPETVKARLIKFKNAYPEQGELVIKQFPSDGITIEKIRNYILTWQDTIGKKVDMIVLDYLDELEVDVKTNSEWSNQEMIAKQFKSLLVELDIPGWSAIQAKKDISGANSPDYFLTQYDGYGSFMRQKKSQLILTIHANHDMMNPQLNAINNNTDRSISKRNISIAKCNYAPAGIDFKDVNFDTTTLSIFTDDEQMAGLDFLPIDVNSKSYKIRKELRKQKHEIIIKNPEEQNIEEPTEAPF